MAVQSGQMNNAQHLKWLVLLHCSWSVNKRGQSRIRLREACYGTFLGVVLVSGQMKNLQYFKWQDAKFKFLSASVSFGCIFPVVFYLVIVSYLPEQFFLRCITW